MVYVFYCKASVVQKIALLAVLFGLFAPTSIFSYTATSSPVLTFTIVAINLINIDGTAVTLQVNSATAGSEPNQVSAATTYDITTNCTSDSKKITAVINSDMPTGLTMGVNLTAPTGGTSLGTVSLSSTAADVVTGIDAVAQSNIDMTFYLDATVAAGVVEASNKTLTLTLVDA